MLDRLVPFEFHREVGHMHLVGRAEMGSIGDVVDHLMLLGMHGARLRDPVRPPGLIEPFGNLRNLVIRFQLFRIVPHEDEAVAMTCPDATNSICKRPSLLPEDCNLNAVCL